MELVDFLNKDHTNWNGYNPDYYACLDYSMTLVENAAKQNIEARIVGVIFVNETAGHAFVAFETTDLGIVYIEPQTDYRYPVLQQGVPLCDTSGKYECLGVVGLYDYIECDDASNCRWATH